jgi:succinate dehydrogenase / fumarate reductase membrane anchor subunit
MLTQVTSLSRSGVSDWVIQRVTAVVLAAYTLCIFGTVLVNPGMDFQTWSGIFSHPAMRVFTMVALLCTCAHAWIGMWTIGSDYLREHTLGSSATALRFIYQVSCVLIVVAYLVWGINILWGS